MKTILVATDFSPAALNAAQYAADMASVVDAELYLLHVYQVPAAYGDVAMLIHIADIEKLAEKDMSAFVNELSRKRLALKLQTEVRPGNFLSELESVCEEITPYTIVMGSQGTTAAERLFFGSHAVLATRKLMWPLITVPASVKFETIKKIGLACDFDNVTYTIPVAEIKILLKDLNAELHILNTGNTKQFAPDTVFESGLLQEMLGTLQPKYHFIVDEETEQGIIDFVERNHIDLLVIFPKRHKLLEKLIYKSHSKQFVLHSHVPVMALHAGADARQQ
jgi:nucleotide-binding universal stress UspA family protein